MNTNKYIDVDIHQKPLVKGTDIKIEDIVYYHEDLGWSIEKIARYYEIEEMPVNHALAFYFENVELIRKGMERENQLKVLMKEKYEDMHI
jgi:uncharacterized protein (DUF433 family)